MLIELQVEKYTAPNSESLAAVTDWLDRNGIQATPGATSQWLNIEVPVAKANALLNTEFPVYEHQDTGDSAIRSLAYSVPASVKPHLDFIYPVTACVDSGRLPSALRLTVDDSPQIPCQGEESSLERPPRDPLLPQHHAPTTRGRRLILRRCDDACVLAGSVQHPDNTRQGAVQHDRCHKY